MKEIMQMSTSELLIEEKRLRKELKSKCCVTQEDRFKKSSYYKALVARISDLNIKEEQKDFKKELKKMQKEK